MFRPWAATLYLLLVCTACRPEGHAPTKWDWSKYHVPDWRTYRARDANLMAGTVVGPRAAQSVDSTPFTFHDLKTDTDQTLIQRLLGQVGERIAYVDRGKARWRYYRGENDPVEFIDLYTQPHAGGTQYGLCSAERYSVTFYRGHIYKVSVAERFGIEGPIFQWPISDHDWSYYEDAMCKSVPLSHAPSYFPAPDVFTAQHVAMLLLPVIDLAGSPAPLPYRLTCRNADKRQCDDNVRRFLGALRLEDIDEFSLANCPLAIDLKSVCFTVKTGEGRLGPFPKWITVKGSTYMENIRVDSVEIDESFTMS